MLEARQKNPSVAASEREATDYQYDPAPWRKKQTEPEAAATARGPLS
jgi:hypothetical protein